VDGDDEAGVKPIGKYLPLLLFQIGKKPLEAGEGREPVDPFQEARPSHSGSIAKLVGVLSTEEETVAPSEKC
jgi:hypothetical protein